MALGKYSRLDGRKSSTSYCSTVTFVAFVGLCLVGVWMMTSSSIVPVQNVDDTSQETKNELQTQVKETSDSNMSSESKISSEENTSDSKPNSESNTSSEKNTSTDNNVDNESGTSSEKDASKDTDPNSESNTSSENSNKSDSNSNSESSTTSESSRSNINSENSKSNTKSDSNASSTVTESNKSNESQPKQFDDNPGDLPEDATKGDNVTVSLNETNSSRPEKTSEHSADDSQEQKPGKQSREEDTNSDSGSKSETGGGEDKKEDVVSKTDDTDFKDGLKNSETDDKKHIDEKSYSGKEKDSEDNSKETKSKLEDGEIKSETSSEQKSKNNTETKIEENKSEEIAGEKKELLPSGAQSELLNETVTQDGAWKTQAAESKKEADKSSAPAKETKSSWKICNVTAGSDYIPCLDNLQAIKSLRTTKHYEHRERHCPDDPPTCLIAPPQGYQRPIEWPTSREKIWYHNVPHTKLAEIKGHQNWVKVSGEYLTFPGGGTQFKHGALHYIDFIQQIVPDIAWGKHSRVVLDVGCGVASFGGFLFDRDVLTMSFAPKDEHEAQVQFALERGIPAFLAVMGTKRLPFPGKVFDIVHCARCRVPWEIEGGKLLLELNRLLRPGGYFVWSATPVYQKGPEDVKIWEAMKRLTKAMCWETVKIAKDRVNGVGIAVFRKPASNDCYEKRLEKEPPLCNESDDPNASWNVPLQVCMHKIPVNATERGSKWPEQWPARLEKPPYWLLSSQVGVYGKPAPDDFLTDYEHWKRVVSKSYITGMGINWSTVRNVMDMRAIYGGFAAALREMKVWVMNVVNVDSPDTLPIIYERGLFGMYHDWCESFSTYPRTYDLVHADHLFSKIKTKCNFEALAVEVDRILRPEGKLLVRDKVETISELETLFRSMQWEVRMTYSKDKEGLLCVEKSKWRPKEAITLDYAIA